jgi:hypothetical protein
MPAEDEETLKALNFPLQAALVVIFLGLARPLHAQDSRLIGSDL